VPQNVFQKLITSHLVEDEMVPGTPIGPQKEIEVILAGGLINWRHNRFGLHPVRMTLA
jgi:hypothetical protein